MVIKVCDRCKSWAKMATEEPCKECLIDDGKDMWEPISNPVVMPNGS